MAQEDYCSYELSKLLKEKGFDGLVFTYYPRGIKDKYNISMLADNHNKHDETSRPTLQMAMKWLREKGYHIVVFTDSPRYEVKIQDLNDGSFNVSDITHTYDTYEEAVEAAIKYSLENLI